MANVERTKYKNDWQKEHVDRINLTVPKGKKAKLQAHATVHRESVNGFTNRAIDETIERDQAHDAMLLEAEALAKKLTDLGCDTTVQDAIRLLEAFSALESVFPTAKQQYLSAIESKAKDKKTGFTPMPLPAHLQKR